MVAGTLANQFLILFFLQKLSIDYFLALVYPTGMTQQDDDDAGGSSAEKRLVTEGVMVQANELWWQWNPRSKTTSNMILFVWGVCFYFPSRYDITTSHVEHDCGLDPWVKHVSLYVAPIRNMGPTTPFNPSC
jgi:hypothetical protein